MTVDGKSELDYLKSTESGNTEVAKEAENYTAASYATKKGSSSLTIQSLLDETGHVTYDNANWEEILDRITFSDMLALVNNGAFQTNAIDYIGKYLTNDSDGPAGYVNFMTGLKEHYKGNTTFACEIVIGSTWNKDLAYQMGKIVGENGLYGDVDGNGLSYSGWYAPAVNLHRSPFSGRNYEYYSEDPILSGKMAVNVINGAAQFGVYTDLKHFALNDQETNRSGIATYCTEQAMRELYLKAFEIAVKGDDDPSQVKTAKADNVTTYQGTMGIMSSFNRIGTRWTGGDYRLLTTILRNEWGFKGLVISDYKTSNAYMDSKQMLYAGNDLILTSTQFYMWNDASSTSVEDMVVLRKAVKNILYTVANSNSVNVTITGYNMEWWMATLIAVDVIVPVGLAVWGFFVIRSFIKKGKETA
jgi:beta-glucosidase